MDNCRVFFFFFQAEDGIRDADVTGVQTCALPIWFAYRPDRDPGGAWSGFPALLVRVPALAVMRRRGRTFVTASTPDAEALLDIGSTAVRAPGARTLSITPLRNPLAWTAAVESAAAKLRGGEAEKVVLAREVLARGDGVVSAGM